jgi:peptide/nickel transport system permease protein
MSSYIARRILSAAFTFVGITIVVFVLIHSVPGDPIQYYIGLDGGARPPEDVIRRIRAAHHLDEPLWKQYAYWVRGVMSLDFGHSLSDKEPVLAKVARKVPNTFTLNLLALLIALAIAIPAGILSAVNSSRWFDRGSGFFFLFLYSLPNFWVALLLMQLFSVELRILPLFGMTGSEYEELSFGARFADRLLHLVLPVVTLAYTQLAIFARFSRSAALEVIRQDFIVAARAKGLSERAVVMRHVFRNALIPLITLLGFIIPYLISGSVIVEQIFRWDGVGSLYLQSVLARDYPTIMGLTVLTAVFTLVASLVADLLYGLADPRIRIETRHG